MENTLRLLTEQINKTEFIISEAKKIGIDKLQFGLDSLDSFINKETMDVHYNGHYKTYVKKLNDALSKKNYGDVELEDIIKSISKYNQTIRNNAGGAFNHALFWKMLTPNKQDIPSEIKNKIIKNFGSINEFKKQFDEVAKERFGSGWCWLILTKGNKLKIMSTPNQDNPLMNVIKDGGFPLLGLDVWEHAYYLKYKNKRDEYIKNFWDVVNWEFVNDLYLKRNKTKLTESIKSKNILSENKKQWTKPDGKLEPKMYDHYLSTLYPKCSPSVIKDLKYVKNLTMPCWGSFNCPECETNYGIIGGKFAVDNYGGIGKWSLLNWFGGNYSVDKKIIDKYNQSQSDDELYKEWIKQNKDNTENKSFEEWVKENKKNESFEEWIEKNKEKFFSEDGEYIESLTDVISNAQKNGTLDRGNQREDIAFEVFNKIPGIEIIRFCNGDKRDKYYGQDFKMTLTGDTKHVQIKPFFLLNKATDSEGNTVFVFKNKNTYRFDKIKLFMFINSPKEYIYFDFTPDNVTIKENESKTEDKYTYIFKKPKKVNCDISKIKNSILTESEEEKNTELEINPDTQNITTQPKVIDTKKEKTFAPFKKETNFNISQRRMRELIRSQYQSCKKTKTTENGCVGTINDENCVTNKGIIGGKYAESEYGGNSKWSLINRWDANTVIHKKILELYNTRNKYKHISFEDWVLSNLKELFSNDGIYTKILADVGSDLVKKGSENENYAKNVIQKIYNLNPNEQGIIWDMYTNCSGSINDTRKGQDIVLEYNNTTYHFQVKTLKNSESDIKNIIDERGNYYRVNSFNSHQKYKMENVDVIVYVNFENDKYILFTNDYNYIQTVPSRSYPQYYINYYEEPIATNMTIEKIPIKPLVGMEKELLKKSKEELYNFYKEKLNYFKEKIKELGYSDEINEQIKNYKHKIINLIMG